MARRLLDTIQNLEEEQTNGINAKERKTVEKIISRNGAKDKQISAKVNMKMYNDFTEINRLQGLSNNSAINMLISKYVRENKNLLEE